MLEIFIGILIIFVASFIQGLTAFGFSLLAVPMLVVFLSPKVVVPVMIIYSLLLNIYLFIEARKDVMLKRIIPLIICGIAGIPFGAWLLKALEPQVLKIIIGVAITFFAVLLILGFRREVKNEKRAFLPIGFISGILNGSISMSGPPVIIFFTNQGMSKNVFRANLIAYFLTLNIFSIPVFFLNGLMTGEVLTHSLYYLPGLLAGAVAGNAMTHKVPEDRFRKIALVVILLSGVLSILSGMNVFS
jgi:hypothetical protein